MHKVIYTRKAKNNLIKINEYISIDNELYAIKTIQNILKTAKMLSAFPQVWRDFGNWLRVLVEKNYKYKIVYKISENKIIIVSIFKYQKIF